MGCVAKAGGASGTDGPRVDIVLGPAAPLARNDGRAGGWAPGAGNPAPVGRMEANGFGGGLPNVAEPIARVIPPVDAAWENGGRGILPW